MYASGVREKGWPWACTLGRGQTMDGNNAPRLGGFTEEVKMEGLLDEDVGLASTKGFCRSQQAPEEAVMLWRTLLWVSSATEECGGCLASTSQTPLTPYISHSFHKVKRTSHALKASVLAMAGKAP